MDCNLLEHKPRKPSQLLYQQVEKQSELCDVTVKVDNWEKVFHWCVLIACPFFERMYKDCFVEKQTGKVRLQIGTPLIIEACLLFLYGKKPTLADDNISEFLQVAEFLMIPNLKYMCIKWLKKQSVTLDNFYRTLELESTYDFKISKCTRYIRAHLPEVFQKTEMINITKEDLEQILSDPTLCYCGMEEKFKFLVRWTNAVPDRNRHFAALFGFIKFEDMSIHFIKTVVQNEILVKEMDYTESRTHPCAYNENEDLKKIVILNSTSNTLKCLDLQTGDLYRLTISQENYETINYDCRDVEITGVNAMECTDLYQVNKSCFYEDGNVYIADSINIHNMASDQTMKTKVVILQESSPITGYNLTCANNECVVLTKTKECKPNKPLGAPLQDDRTYFDVTTICKGKLTEGVTIVQPVLVLPKQCFHNICINKSNVIAMFSDNNNALYLYDQTSFSLEIMHLNADYNFKKNDDDELAPSSNGFVIYNNKRAFCIERLADPSLHSRYKTYIYKYLQSRNKKYMYNFNHIGESMVYMFHENMWFNYRDALQSNVLYYTTHDDILATEAGREVTWTPVRLPDSNMIWSRLFTIFIPRNKSKCHMKCPHCDEDVDDDNNDDGEGNDNYEDDEDYENGEDGDSSCIDADIDADDESDDDGDDDGDDDDNDDYIDGKDCGGRRDDSFGDCSGCDADDAVYDDGDDKDEDNKDDGDGGNCDYIEGVNDDDENEDDGEEIEIEHDLLRMF